MSAFTILLGGDFTPTPRAISQIAGTRVIAADSGMRHAATLGIVPELWVGDFDSVPNNLSAELATVERELFPADKNDTDGELAVSAAQARGATSLILVGAFGGPRADHAFLHLTLAMRLAEAGARVTLTSGEQEGIPLLVGDARFDYEPETVFSVIAFDDLVDLTLEGVRWPLDRFFIPFGSSRTISNQTTGPLTVRLGKGRAMLIAHPYPGPEF